MAFMTGATLKSMLALALLFCATLGAMRAQPYDDGGLWAQLAPPDCAQPCFLGIRPGVTTRVEALALLTAHSWVSLIHLPDDQTITWKWNGRQPLFLHTASEDSRLLIQDGIVHAIGVRTAARMGDVKIVFGTPDITYYFNWYTRDSAKNYFSYFEQHGIYYGDQFEAASSTVCPVSNQQMWELPVILALPASPDYSDILPVVRDAFASVPKECR
jgi:hypothetical protein